MDGWINIYFDPANPKAPGYRRVVGKTSDNKVLSPAYEAMLRATLPEDQHATMLDGGRVDGLEDPNITVLNKDLDSQPISLPLKQTNSHGLIEYVLPSAWRKLLSNGSKSRANL